MEQLFFLLGAISRRVLGARTLVQVLNARVQVLKAWEPFGTVRKSNRMVGRGASAPCGQAGLFEERIDLRLLQPPLTRLEI